ncbi:MAG: alpha/beta fold hydrolase [Segetibacter sp.]|nr:alpha/beta fold hydrolase [Segetibacter sp.]
MDTPADNKIGRKKVIFRWLKVFIIIYCLVGIAIYYLQEKILFRPDVLKAQEVYKFNQPFKEVNLPLNKTTTLNIIQFTVADSFRRGIVLYFHGNKGNVSRYQRFVNNFTKQGYEVWMPDYPGFGKSTGTLSEQVLYDQALQVYRMARVKFMPDSIIIYGKSMGTGIAAQLASVRDCKRLLLETPYYSMTSLASNYIWMYPVGKIIKYDLPTYKHLAKVTAPVTIFQGTEDDVVPYRNAERLRPLLKKGDEFITIQNGGHKNLNNDALMQSKLDSLLRL